MTGCDFVARAESEEELVERGTEHARVAHGLLELDPETENRVRAAIHDV
ncbi:MAG: DUF1059 domain-containing protein [Longimicrobiales bacterium]